MSSIECLVHFPSLLYMKMQRTLYTLNFESLHNKETVTVKENITLTSFHVKLFIGSSSYNKMDKCSKI